MTAEKKGNILIVEDQPELLEAYSMILENSGYNIFQAETGSECLDFLQKEEISLVLLDVILPDTNGFDILQIVKSDKKTESIFVVLISSKVKSSEEQAEGLETGADGYLIKPIQNRELLARIDSFMRHKNTIDELRFSEERFRKISDKNVDGIMIVDKEGIIRFSNPSAQKIIFKDQQPLQGQPFGISIIDKENAEIDIQHDNELIRTAELRATVITWENQQMQLVSIRDISERILYEKMIKDNFKELEKSHNKLIEKEEILQSYINNSPLAIFVLSSGGLVQYLNPAADKLIDDDSHTLFHKDFTLLFHPEVKSNDVTVFKKMLIEDNGVTLDSKLIIHNGTPIDVTMDAVLLNSGEILVFCKDITESKRIKLEIETSEKRLKNIVDKMPVMMVALDEANKVVAWNTECERVTGYTSNEIIESHNSLEKIFKNQKTYQDFIDSQNSDYRDREWELKSKNGENRMISWSNISREIEIPEWHTWAIGLNISERKKAELKMLKINEALQESVENIQKMNEELHVATLHAEESDRLKSAFLANMSHEIRTPMNAIIGFSDLLSKNDVSNEKRQKYADIIQNSGNQLLHIISDIVDISKIESGQLTTDEEWIDVNMVLESTVEKHRESKKCISNNNEIILQIPKLEKGYFIKSDKSRFIQILDNLMTNALKFTQNGTVTVGYNCFLNDNKDKIQFFVKDTGVGIPPDQLEKVFERFSQADNFAKHEGTGLGLSIIKGIIKLLNGNIWVQSEEHKGTSFFFTLPYDEKGYSTIYMNQTGELNDIPDFSDKKIFVAEDDMASKLYLEEILECTKAKISTVGNGVELLALLEKENPDVILLDIQMPIMDGKQTLVEIRKNHKDIPVIVQTAYAMQHESKEVLKMGCDDYISKPINQSKLLIMLNELLNKKNYQPRFSK